MDDNDRGARAPDAAGEGPAVRRKMRLLFEKTGPARLISHLDLMRTLQRAFARAELPLAFSEGFNPHPYLSIARPLPVGVESRYELLDFGLSAAVDPGALPARLNCVLPAGVRVRRAYPASEGRKSFGDIAWAIYEIRLAWDRPSAHMADGLRALFAGGPLPILKKSKRGEQTVDIAPLIHRLTLTPEGEDRLCAEAVLAAGTTSLNPSHVLGAVRRHAPELWPDHQSALRVSLLDADGALFV
ncbi:MAG: TIGR03936 family radical SAM-associated protein [Oscillospiraceae bacterium]|jgi:radical SAM-linked protein|nr:TIGR03936 family radical SAM-associated protein [Oscillospiraceae bacterium]